MPPHARSSSSSTFPVRPSHSTRSEPSTMSCSMTSAHGRVRSAPRKSTSANIHHTTRAQMFATPDTIEARADALFRSLTEQNFLAGTNRDGFAAGAAVFAELNAIHFARKGNGRTNRLLLSARAANAGHALAFDLITRERMIAVSVAADEDDPSGLRRMHPHHPRWATLRRRADRARGNRLRAAG